MFNALKKTIFNDTLPADVTQQILAAGCEFTPDIAELESRQYSFVFMPDECMMLERKHELVTPGASGFYPFYEDCYTSEDFCFIEKRLGKESFPIAFKPLDNGDLPIWMNKKQRIKGELYALRGCSFKDLDKYKLNTVQCNRVKVNINIPTVKQHRTETQSYNGLWSCEYNLSKTYITTISAYMYVGREEYWIDQLLHHDSFFNFAPVHTTEVDRIYIKKCFNYKHKE